MTRPRASYHTIIFAPDTLDPDDGPTVEVRESGFAGQGTQTTLPVDEPEAVLYDHRERPISFSHPRPLPRPIGFRAHPR